MVGSKTGERKTKMSLEHLVVTDSKEVLKNKKKEGLVGRQEPF